MDTNINFKYAIVSLAGSVLMFSASAISSPTSWLAALLLLAAITFLIMSGAYYIKATWMKNDENRDKRHWDILDSRMLS